jgi:hypothetical protein
VGSVAKAPAAAQPTRATASRANGAEPDATLRDDFAKIPEKSTGV